MKKALFVVFCSGCLAISRASPQLQYNPGQQQYQQPAYPLQRPNNNPQGNAQNGWRPQDGVKPWPAQPTLYPYRVGPQLPSNRYDTANPQNAQQMQAPRVQPSQSRTGQSQTQNNNNNNAQTQPYLLNQRVEFQMQLNQYGNANRQLPGNRICYDANAAPPPAFDGSSDQNQQQQQQTRADTEWDCQLTFIASIVSPGDPVISLSTLETLQLTSQRTTVNIGDEGTWMNPHSFPLRQKPIVITVTVLHSGNIRYLNGSWPYRNARYSVVMDSFTVNLTNIKPGVSAAMTNKNERIRGTILQTDLWLSYGFWCVNNFKGEKCDLKCNITSTNQDGVICQSAVTGLKSVCRYHTQNQVSQCKVCLLGVYSYTENGRRQIECRTEENGERRNYVMGVSRGWKTWAIVLGVFLVFAIVVLIVLCCIALLQRRKGRRHTPWSKIPYSRPDEKPKPTTTTNVHAHHIMPPQKPPQQEWMRQQQQQPRGQAWRH